MSSMFDHYNAEELFGTGVESADADDPTVPLEICTDPATGLVFTLNVRRPALRQLEPINDANNAAEQMADGPEKDKAIAEADCLFLSLVVPSWEKLNLANFYIACNDGRTYSGGPIEELKKDPKKTIPYSLKLLHHMYRNAWPDDLRNKVQRLMRQTVNRTLQGNEQGASDSGASSS